MSDMNTVKNWSYPFKTAGESSKEVTDPQVYFDALAQAENGFYPMGKNGLWHGGVHFDDKTAALLDQSSIRCIADGEVIAYRIDKLYPKTLYSRSAARGTRGVEKDFSTGFVLVKHRLALPPAPPPPAPSTSAATTPSTGTTPAETSGETAPEATSTSPEPATEPEFLTFYSLYMHLLDLAGYEANPALQRPAFWDAGLCKVKSDAPDKVLGLNVREHHKPDIRDEDYEANNAKYENKLTTLPRGTRIETGEAAASPNHNWRRLIRATPAVEGLAENTGWVYVPEAKELAENHYLVSEDKSKDIPALEQIGLHVRESANATSNVLAVLPRGTEITVSGEGKYVKLETIVSGNAIPPLSAGTDGKLPGYVWLESLEAQRSPNDLAKDKVYPLAEAQSIKAGELIGHMGLYQEHDQESPTSRLHLELFSCEDVPAFIEKSKERAASLPNDQKTLILVDKKSLIYQPVPADTQIAAEHDVRAATDSPTEGCWVKVHPYVVLKAKKADFGNFDGSNSRYPMGAAKKAELANEFDLDVSELPDTVDFLLESYKEDGSDMYSGKTNIPSTHVRRKVGIKLNTPVWVKRSVLNAEGRRISTTSTLEAWESFPLSQATDNSQECGFARILSKASWDDLSVDHKAVNADTEKTRWWYVTVANEAGQDISGWVPEVAFMVTQHSPWGWPGFSDIQDTTTLVSQQAQSLSAQGELSTEEAKTYAAKIDEAEHGEIFKELFKIIDQPNSEGVCDKKLTPLEIKNALGKPWLAQQLSLLITHYESEWFWKEEKWDELDKLMEHTPEAPNLQWVREKERIKRLSWWSELAGKQGINTDGRAWHFHAPAILGNFSSNGCKCKTKLTKEQLRTIAPHASSTKIDLYIDPINEMFETFNIDHCISRAHVLAQMLKESGSLNFVTEGLDSDSPLPAYHPYIGRGLLQITWEANYRAYGNYIGENFIGHPHYLKMSQPPHCVVSIGWFWSEFKNLSKFSDNDDFIYLTYLINGGFNGYDHRLSFLNSSVDVLKINTCTKLNISGSYRLEDSEAYNKAKPSFAWGLWSDPDSSSSGKTKDKAQAIAGYSRYLEIYNSTQSVRDDTSTRYYSSTRRALQAKEHAEQRIEALRNS